MALPIHFMAVLPLPVWAIKIINRRCRGFIWKGEEAISGGHCLLPWAQVCTPKECGGLGVLNLRWFGWALRCRWPWLKWEENPRPWHLLPDSNEKEVMAMFSAATAISLGDGDSARFWTDNWLPSGRSIATLAPALFSFVKDSGRSVREALHSQSWIRDIAGGISVQALAQYLSVWDIVQATNLMPGTRDRAIWKLTKEQEFTVSSTYRLLFMANVRFACNKPIWRSKAPPRCKFFMWLAVHGKCLTADNLLRRGWPANTSCPLCLSELENCTHLFVHCRFTQQLWRLLKSRFGALFTTPDDRFSCIEDWWLQAKAGVPKTMRRNFDTIAILMHCALEAVEGEEFQDFRPNGEQRRQGAGSGL